MPGLHLYTIVQFLALSVVFYYYYEHKSLWRRLVLINGIVAFMVALADACWVDGILHTNTLSRSYAAVSMFVYALIYFYHLFQQDGRQYDFYDPMFWFAVAVLIYFANNILYFMIRRYLLIYYRDMETAPFVFYLSLNIIAHILYAQSFRRFGKWKTIS